MIKYKIIQSSDNDRDANNLFNEYYYSDSVNIAEEINKGVYVILIITHQDFIGNQFYLHNKSPFLRTDTFTASDKFRLTSCVCPDFPFGNYDNLFVRGNDSTKNYHPCILPIDIIDRVVMAIEEYNLETVDRVKI